LRENIKQSHLKELDSCAYLCLTAFMRTTVDLSDELFRQVKAAAALRGRKFKELVEEGLRRVLEFPDDHNKSQPAKKTLSKLMEDACGVAKSGVNDLGSNPKHMNSFGRD
jgi:Arc/MetJ family transcription regulator